MLGRQLEAAAARRGLSRRGQPIVIVAQRVLATLGVVLGIGIAVVALTSWRHAPTAKTGGGRPPTTIPMRLYRDPTGWSAIYPAVFHLESSEQEVGLAAVEVTIASFTPQPGIRVHAYRDGGTARVVPPLDPTGRFPDDAVALRIVDQSGMPELRLRQRKSQLRLSLASLRPSSGPHGQLYNAATGETYRADEYHGAPESMARTVSTLGKRYTVAAWIGLQASQGLRDALARMIASLSFS